MAGEKPGPGTKALSRMPPPTRTPNPPETKRPTPPEFRRTKHSGTDTGETVIPRPRVPVKIIRHDEDEGGIPVDVEPAEERKPMGGMELNPGGLAALLRPAVSRSSCFDPAQFAEGIRRAFRCREGETGDGASYISIEMEDAGRFRLYDQEANSASVEKRERCRQAADLTIGGESLSLYREMPELEAGPLMAMLGSAENYRPEFNLAGFARTIMQAFGFGEGEWGTGTPYTLIRTDDANLYRLYDAQANMASIEKWEKCRLKAELRIDGEMFFLYWEPKFKPRE